MGICGQGCILIIKGMKVKTNNITGRHSRKLLEIIEAGLVSKDTVLNSCINYMSEDDILDMMESEGFLPDDEEEEEEDDENEN